MGMYVGVNTMKNSVAGPQKLGMKLSYDPVMPLLGMCSKKPKTFIGNNVYTPIFTAALFAVAKIWSNPGVHQQKSG